MRALTKRLTGLQNVHGTWLTVCLFNLLAAAGLGVLLRYVFVEPQEALNFKNVLHAHSHTALLGWLHAGIYVFFHRFFVPAHRQNRPGYHYIFWLSQLLVLGCFIFFPVYGYNALTITITSLHVVLTYWFALLFFKDSRSDPRTSVKWARIALLWIITATLSVWALAPVTVILGKGDPSYVGAVQFYLHFQFNGFHVFAFFALLIRHLEQKAFFMEWFRRPVFVLLLIFSVFLMFGYNMYWIYDADELYPLFAAGAVLELALFIATAVKAGSKIKKVITDFPLVMKVVFYTAIGSLLIKSLIQTGLVFPFVADTVVSMRHLFVAFLHMSFLGTMTLSFVFYAYQSGIWKTPDGRVSTAGSYVFLAGYTATELLLITQGMMLWSGTGMIPSFYELLVVAAGLLFIGVLLWTGSVILRKQPA